MEHYDKLVRDNIPAIIRKSGKRAIIEIADDEAYLQYLYDKLKEEMVELIEAIELRDIVAEIADVREVLNAFMELKGIKREDVESVIDEKSRLNGAFYKKIILKGVT